MLNRLRTDSCPGFAHACARLLAGAVLAVGLCGGADAQTNNTVTSSTSRTPDTFVDTTLPTLPLDTAFQTRIVGLLQGDPTLYYDQTFAFAFADPTVQAGLLAAQDALSVAAAPDPLVFFGPINTASSRSLLSTDTVASVTGEQQNLTITLEDTVGPGTILIGNRGPCEGLLNQQVGCPDDPRAFDVLAGTANINVNQNYQFEYTRELQTTERYRLFETWQITGVPQLAQVPLPGTLVLIGLGLAALGGASRRRTT